MMNTRKNPTLYLTPPPFSTKNPLAQPTLAVTQGCIRGEEGSGSVGPPSPYGHARGRRVTSSWREPACAEVAKRNSIASSKAPLAVPHDREVRDIWSDLGLEEMDDPSDNDMSWWSQGSKFFF